MTTRAELEQAITAAEAELHDLAEQAKTAYQTWAALDCKVGTKADEAKELRRQLRQMEAGQ